MKVETTERKPDGTPKLQTLWGVGRVPEKRTLKENAEERAVWGEEWENVTAGFYVAQISLMGKSYYVGKAATPQAAARIFDSALFHLWGFILRPRPRFNFLKPEDLPHNPPLLLPSVQTLKTKIVSRVSGWNLDVSLFDFTFLNRHDERRALLRQATLDNIPSLGWLNRGPKNQNNL